MRILFTGASSFTGCHFVRALAAAGHEVVCTMTRGLHDYEGLRRRRVDAVSEVAEIVWNIRFGDEQFLGLLDSSGGRGESRGGFDLLCHHAADVTNYKSPDFDAVVALANNTHNLTRVLGAFASTGGRRVLLTGSVFEGGEGAGSDGLPHFSPYGLSKALTAQVFGYECARHGLRLGKFVIPNPVGPLEDPRFTAYLVKNWAAGETPAVRTPSYVRDNIHVSLLAAAYRAFAGALPETPGFSKTSPSGYVESQGAFALRFAREMEARLGIPCPVDLPEQTEFTEPRIRIGTDQADPAALGWEEAAAWDEFADFYADMHDIGGRTSRPSSSARSAPVSPVPADRRTPLSVPAA